MILLRVIGPGRLVFSFDLYRLRSGSRLSVWFGTRYVSWRLPLAWGAR